MSNSKNVWWRLKKKKTYTLVFNDKEAINAIRKLRKRGVDVKLVIVVVETDEHRKLFNIPERKRNPIVEQPLFFL